MGVPCWLSGAFGYTLYLYDEHSPISIATAGRPFRAAFRGFAESIGAEDAPAKIDVPAALRAKDMTRAFGALSGG